MRPEEVATPEAFRLDPVMVWRFYHARRQALAGVEPNPAHRALVALERHLAPGCFTLITQNVDDLHQRAGSRVVLPMHGELRKVRCTGCGAVGEPEGQLDSLPRCPCGALLRPHVVWFGEMPLHLAEIAQALRAAQLFVVIGSSGRVYPAASFIFEARTAGARTVGINIEAPETDWVYDEFHLGKAGELLPGIVQRWISASREAGEEAG
jgi:NAD-dependent deacetylase